MLQGVGECGSRRKVLGIAKNLLQEADIQAWASWLALVDENAARGQLAVFSNGLFKAWSSWAGSRGVRRGEAPPVGRGQGHASRRRLPENVGGMDIGGERRQEGEGCDARAV